MLNAKASAPLNLEESADRGKCGELLPILRLYTTIQLHVLRKNTGLLQVVLTPGRPIPGCDGVKSQLLMRSFFGSPR